MANLQNYGFFDFQDGDGDLYRYTSEEFATYMKGITGNGIAGNWLNAFRITNPEPGLLIAMSTGCCFIEGRFGYTKTTTTVNLDAAASGKKRIDRVILRLDVGSRAISVEVLKGTETTGTPSAPSLTQTTSIYEIPMYSVRIEGSNATVSDERVILQTPDKFNQTLKDLSTRVSANETDLYAIKQGQLGRHSVEAMNYKSKNDWASFTGYDLDDNRAFSVMGDTSTHRLQLLEFDQANSGKADRYLLPTPSSSLAADNYWSILTSKNAITVAQGGTGAKTASEALTNLGAAPAVHTHSAKDSGIVYGKSATVSIAAGGYADITINFTSGTFTSAPTVFAQLSIGHSAHCAVINTNTTKDKTVVRVWNDGTQTRDLAVNWVAFK